MSEFDFELDGMPVEAEPVVPAPGPPAELPGEVTARFAAEAARLESGVPAPTTPESHPEPPAPAAELTADEQRQQQINAWVDAQIDQRVQAQVAERIDEEIASLYEQYDPATVDALISQLPPETRQAIAERHGAYVEAVEFSELLASEATQERAQAVVDAGVAELRSLVAGWEEAEPGGVPVDLAQLQRLAEERWPAVAALVDDPSPELATGVYREVWQELKVEAQGEQAAYAMVEAELRLIGIEPDPARVLAARRLGDELWPAIVQQFGSDDQEAARQALRAAVRLQAGGREPTNPTAVTKFYGEQARQIRRGEGQVDGAPPARPGELSLPSLTTAKFAAQAAAIKARGGQP